jgi:hypothetical protein
VDPGWICSGAAQCSPPPARELVFLSVGDWGGSTKSEKAQVAMVSDSMAQFALLHPTTQFVVSVGDNFYPYGVLSASDPRWNDGFLSVFGAPSLSPLKWFGVLGNHDYAYKPAAQVEYTLRSVFVLLCNA